MGEAARKSETTHISMQMPGVDAPVRSCSGQIGQQLLLSIDEESTDGDGRASARDEHSRNEKTRCEGVEHEDDVGRFSPPNADHLKESVRLRSVQLDSARKQG